MNEIEMFDISCNTEKKSLEKNLSEFSKDLPSNNTIKMNTNLEQTISSYEVKFLCEELKDNRTSQFYLDTIQLINIKDENYFESGIKIETLLNSITDISVEKCENCKINENFTFCTTCKKHFCNICNQMCKNINHNLKDLYYLKNKIDNYKKFINIFISKYFFEVSKNEKKEGEGIEKKEKNKTFDSNDFNSGIDESLSNYTNDIRLIKTIIDKNYTNYYHYLNIEECHIYITKKYQQFAKSCLIDLSKSEDMQLQIVENDNKIKNIALIGIEDYLEEIYMNLLLEERNNIIKPKSEYMMNQIEVNELMRATLIDWIIEIHYSFKFTQETLFTTIWLIDTYLSFELVNRQQFQLLGITCLLISCKYHEIIYPNGYLFKELAENVCTKTENAKMENLIKSKLNFYVTSPNPINFFLIISQIFNLEKSILILDFFLSNLLWFIIRY